VLAVGGWCGCPRRGLSTGAARKPQRRPPRSPRRSNQHGPEARAGVRRDLRCSRSSKSLLRRRRLAGWQACIRWRGTAQVMSALATGPLSQREVRHTPRALAKQQRPRSRGRRTTTGREAVPCLSCLYAAPGQSLLELEVAGKTAVQCFDGKNGWMKRPYLRPRDPWEPFSAEQTNRRGQVGTSRVRLSTSSPQAPRWALEGIEPVRARTPTG